LAQAPPTRLVVFRKSSKHVSVEGQAGQSTGGTHAMYAPPTCRLLSGPAPKDSPSPATYKAGVDDGEEQARARVYDGERWIGECRRQRSVGGWAEGGRAGVRLLRAPGVSARRSVYPLWLVGVAPHEAPLYQGHPPTHTPLSSVLS